MTDLTQQTAIVTGSARGIGAELAAGLAAAGANVVVTDIQDPGATVEKITANGGAATGIVADITDNDSLAALLAHTNATFGSPSVLVNNAGLFADLELKPFTQIDEDEFDRVMTINVRGMFQAVKAVVPAMTDGGGGSIINISSGTFFYGPPGMLHYVASKAAVVGMTRSMARELGASNIRVNAIAPGFTESDSVLAAGNFERIREPSKAGRMIEREMRPQDLVGAVTFLASPDSGFMTGQLVNIDGGKTTY
ncbi:MAG: SDR family NAD(P)-dependent oxidoreductase [Acidimicrobiales bacterium]